MNNQTFSKWLLSIKYSGSSHTVDISKLFQVVSRVVIFDTAHYQAIPISLYTNKTGAQTAVGQPGLVFKLLNTGNITLLRATKPGNNRLAQRHFSRAKGCYSWTKTSLLISETCAKPNVVPFSQLFDMCDATVSAMISWAICTCLSPRWRNVYMCE